MSVVARRVISHGANLEAVCKIACSCSSGRYLILRKTSDNVAHSSTHEKRLCSLDQRQLMCGALAYPRACVHKCCAQQNFPDPAAPYQVCRRSPSKPQSTSCETSPTESSRLVAIEQPAGCCLKVVFSGLNATYRFSFRVLAEYVVVFSFNVLEINRDKSSELLLSLLSHILITRHVAVNPGVENIFQRCSRHPRTSTRS